MLTFLSILCKEVVTLDGPQDGRQDKSEDDAVYFLTKNKHVNKDIEEATPLNCPISANKDALSTYNSQRVAPTDPYVLCL